MVGSCLINKLFGNQLREGNVTKFFADGFGSASLTLVGIPGSFKGLAKGRVQGAVESRENPVPAVIGIDDVRAPGPALLAIPDVDHWEMERSRFQEAAG